DQQDRLKIAILSIDPSRKRTGGALLGDRIRMNAIDHPNVFMRSMATRDTGSEISAALPDAIAACKLSGFDLVIVETSGIGQGDAAIVPHVDVSLYVMTPEVGAASQRGKIDMLDFADFVAINKYDRKGAPDAMPVFGTIASRFNADGVTALYQALAARLAGDGLPLREHRLRPTSVRHSTGQHAIVPPARARYLAEIATSVRSYRGWAESQAKAARERQQVTATRDMLRASPSA